MGASLCLCAFSVQWAGERIMYDDRNSILLANSNYVELCVPEMNVNEPG